jgi:hypothetical protein
VKDAALKRFERDAVAACLASAVIATVVPAGGWRVAAGVLGGGMLIGVSYWGIKSGVERLVQGTSGGRRRIVWPLVLFAGRYALLLFLAYVMIARLRLHPIGLLIGASSVVVAAAIEAGRTWKNSTTNFG